MTKVTSETKVTAEDARAQVAEWRAQSGLGNRLQHQVSRWPELLAAAEVLGEGDRFAELTWRHVAAAQKEARQMTALSFVALVVSEARTPAAWRLIAQLQSELVSDRAPRFQRPHWRDYRAAGLPSRDLVADVASAHRSVFKLVDDAETVLQTVGVRGSIAELANVLRHPDLQIMILGPPGSGKSTLALELGRLLNSEPAHVNCASAPAVIEAQLLGYEKGAFTGADKAKQGILKKYEGKAVFLDEVHALGEKARDQLLVALEHGTYLPVGSDTRITTHFKLISATTRDASEIEWSDAFWSRIDGFRISMPSWGELDDNRRECLVDTLLEECFVLGLVSPFADENRAKARAAAMAVDKLPGNLRRLKQVFRQVACKVQEVSEEEVVGLLVPVSDLPSRRIDDDIPTAKTVEAYRSLPGNPTLLSLHDKMFPGDLDIDEGAKKQRMRRVLKSEGVESIKKLKEWRREGRI